MFRSWNNEYICVASVQNVENRLRLHNKGKVKSTKGYKPGILLKVHNCETRADAMRPERFMKTGQ